MAQGRRLTTLQRARFIAVLAETANVRAAAGAIGVSWQTVYRVRDVDPEFAKEWTQAVREATDELHGEAFRRAMKGTRRYVVSQGRIVMVPTGELDNEGKPITEPLVEHVYSDALMIALLKAHRPELFNVHPPSLAATPFAIPADLAADPEPTPDEPGPSA